MRNKRNTLMLVVLSLLVVLIATQCAAPAPEQVVVKETVVVEKEVEKEKIVEKTVVVEKEVEVQAEIGKLRNVRLTHGGSLCNLPWFVAFEHPEWWVEYGLSPESVPSPSITEQVAALNGGLVDFAGAPYTSQIASIAQSEGTLKIVSGVGGGGLGLITQKGKETPESLKGSKWGLSPSDTLEVLGYKWLQKNGMSYDDIEIVYEAAGVDIMGSFASQKLDVVNCVQPYCDDMAVEYGAVVLAEGRDIFGDNYSDCVLATSTTLMENEPEVIVGLIKVLMRAQKEVEQNLDESLNIAFGKWFRVSEIGVAQRAMEKVFPMVDQRNQVEFIMGGVDFMLELGYLPEDLKANVDSPDEVFDWSFLEQAIKESPELYGELQRKSN